jgi:hypothetical protein
MPPLIAKEEESAHLNAVDTPMIAKETVQQRFTAVRSFQLHDFVSNTRRGAAADGDAVCGHLKLLHGSSSADCVRGAR